MTSDEMNQTAAKSSAVRLDKRTAGLLAAVVLVGLVLRAWGLGWSLPDARHPFATYHPDERINLSAAQQADVSHLKFDIGFYNYGAFYFYLVNVAETVGRGYGIVPKPPENADQPPTLEAQAKENAGLFLMGRLVTMLMGTATIPVLFALGRRLWNDSTGLLAAFAYAVLPLAVVHAHFLTVDVPATLFVALALLWSARLLHAVTVRDIILAGIWSGLAAATKYNAGLVLIAPVSALILNNKEAKSAKEKQRTTEDTEKSKIQNLKSKIPTPALSYCLLPTAYCLTFLLACPGVWLNWDAFWNGIPGYPGSGVRYELFEHSRTGHGELFVQTGFGGWYHLVVSLWQGLTLPVLVVFLAGLWRACVKRTAGDWMLLAFFVVYGVACSFSAVRFARYMLPLFPVICVWVARVIVEAKSSFPMKFLGAGALFFGGIVGCVLAYTMTQPDPRDRAADWLESHAAPGASVAFGRVPWFSSPPLSPRFGLPAAPERAKAAQETTRFALRIPAGKEWDTSILTPPTDYIVVSNLETLHPVRLKQPDALQFLDAAKAGRRAQVFGQEFFLLTMGSSPAAEDLLYILPVVTIYAR